MATCYTYQLRSATELLYVGKTRRWPARLSEHKRDQPWWHEVTNWSSEEFATEDEAIQREKEVWAAERPKYNKVSPFRTHEETLEYQREYSHTPEYRRYNRERQRVRYHEVPECRERAIERARRNKNLGRRWQQTGPGLF